MSLILNQISVPVSGSGAVYVALVPANATVTLSVPVGGQTVYIGQGTPTTTTLTSTNGFPVNPGGPQVNFTIPPTAQVVNLWALNSSGATPTALGVAVTVTA